MIDRRILITCLVILLMICFVVSCASLLGAGIYFWNIESSSLSSYSDDILNTQNQPQIPPEVDAEVTESSSNPDDQASNGSSNDADIDPKITSQMDDIQMQVILERGLKPTENIDRKLYSPQQLRQKITQDFNEDYSLEEAREEALTLAAFGLLQPDFDLHTLYTDLYSEQIAGFYDVETKEMVVVQGESFGGLERFTYAHEYTHVLQDQNFDIENGLNFNDEVCKTEAERCSAILALIEGDATSTQFRWFFSNATTRDQAEILEMIAKETAMPVFDSAPEFIALGLTFPYEYGYLFVERLFNIGGWGTVDRAYQNPPLSTEQILHPDRYPDDKPIPVELPEFDLILDNGWKEIDRGIMGEWYTYLILAKGLDEDARIDDDQAKIATEGWGGDAYAVYYNANTGKTVMVLHTIWDTPSEADEYADSFRDYATERFGKSSSDSWQGKDGYHSFYHHSTTTTWILAPDAEMATDVWQMIQP